MSKHTRNQNLLRNETQGPHPENERTLTLTRKPITKQSLTEIIPLQIVIMMIPCNLKSQKNQTGPKVFDDERPNKTKPLRIQ